MYETAPTRTISIKKKKKKHTIDVLIKISR